MTQEVRMNKQTWQKGFAIFLVLVFGLVVIGLVADNSTGSTTSLKVDKKSSTTTATTTDQPVSQAVIKVLTVKSTSVDCPTVVVANNGSTLASNGETIVKYDVGSIKGVPPRLWSDAISTPYVNTDPQKILGEAQASICINPVEGSMLGHYLAHKMVGNVSVLSLNPWLKPFAGDVSEVNKVAAGYIPLLDVSKPTKAQVADSVAQNVAWQQMAEKLDTMLTRFALVGVKADPSVLNYHLVAGGLVVGGLPEVGLNPNQESLPALQLELTEKGACAPLAIIGFNIGDQRLEEFAPPTCVAPPRPSSTAPPKSVIKTTTTAQHSTTTTKPSITTTTTRPTTTTIPSCTSGKCIPPTTVAPPPTTTPPPDTTAQPHNGGQGDSGEGATNTTTPPTTVAPTPAPPITAPPVVAPAGPPGG
jgi:hypothetical protein